MRSRGTIGATGNGSASLLPNARTSVDTGSEMSDMQEAAAPVTILDSRPVPLGGLRAMTVHRTLPQRGRSLIGSWCFLDHYGPDNVEATGGMFVPRHPHTGLATVSWLFSGEIDHLDSGGNAARVRPGELNLMIAGRGITHQELSVPDTTLLHGVQLWYALPDATRFSDNAFIHYVPQVVDLGDASARVFIGELCGSISPVDTRTPELLGAEITLQPHASLRLQVRADFEHGVLAESGTVAVNGTEIAHRSLGYVGVGATTLTVTTGAAAARIVLLGGVPLGEQIVMWWNFIGRNHDEIVEFRERYQAELGFEEPAASGAPGSGMHSDAGRPRHAAPASAAGAAPLFGRFPADAPAPLPAPPLPLSRLVPRG